MRAIVTAGAVEPNETRESIVGAVGTLLEAGIADGTLRDDVLADDIVMSMLGGSC